MISGEQLRVEVWSDEVNWWYGGSGRGCWFQGYSIDNVVSEMTKSGGILKVSGLLDMSANINKNYNKCFYASDDSILPADSGIICNK